MRRCTDIVNFYYGLCRKFALNAEEIVVNVRIADTFRKNNPGQDGCVRVEGGPTRQVAGRLRADALSGIGGRSGKRWRCTAGRTSACHVVASGRSIDGRVAATKQNVVGEIEGIVRQVPPGIRKRVVESSLIGEAKTTAQRGSAVTHYVPGKPNPRSPVIVVTLAQTFCRSETSRPTFAG